VPVGPDAFTAGSGPVGTSGCGRDVLPLWESPGCEHSPSSIPPAAAPSAAPRAIGPPAAAPAGDAAPNCGGRGASWAIAAVRSR